MIPISDLWAEDSTLYTYSFQAFTQISKSKGTGDYVDVYISSELSSPKMPLISDILTIDIRAGIKKGSKRYTKDETAK